MIPRRRDCKDTNWMQLHVFVIENYSLRSVQYERRKPSMGWVKGIGKVGVLKPSFLQEVIFKK